MFLFSYSFKPTVWKNPTQDRRATNSISTPPAPPRHPTAPSPSPHPPYPPPTAATSTKSHFLCLSNRYWFNNYENISSCLNISTGVYTGPLYDMWNLSTWKRKDNKRTQLNIVWLINPPTELMSGLQCHRGRPRQRENNRKIPFNQSIYWF